MSQFRFIPVKPHPLLSSYIARINVFESSGQFAREERKLIVPNANFKLTLTYRNGIVADVGDKTFEQSENKLSLTGLIDLPVNLDPMHDNETGTIILEFNPLGSHRFFHLSYAEVKNQIVSLDDLIGNRAVELQEQLAEANTVDLKLQMLQNFLLERLKILLPDPINDYCISRISPAVHRFLLWTTIFGDTVP